MPLTGEKSLQYQREYREANKEKLEKVRKDRIQEQREYIRAIKEATPCADCNKRYSYWIMQFDHVRGEKKYTLNRLGKIRVAWTTLFDEIEKCEIVCSNCHADRTFQRNQAP